MIVPVLLLPISVLYATIAEIRNWFFDLGIFRVQSVRIPVISVGNITAGGTGKTPIVDYIAKLAVQNGFRPAILSRGYKGSYKDFAKVDLQDAEASRIYGDEPTLLAQRNPDVPVFVCRNRVQGAKQIEERNLCNLLILDDALQHRWLKRDADVVILDSSADMLDYWPLPSGRGRETFQALKRAQLVVFTRVSEPLRDRIEALRLRFPKAIPSVEFEFRVRSFRLLDQNEKIGPEKIGFRAAIAMSGIGRPQSFEQVLKTAGVDPVCHLKFSDHHEFRVQDLKELQNIAQKFSLENVIVTEKDAVKLRRFQKDLTSVRIWVAELELNLRSGKEYLDDLLHRVAHSNYQ